MHLGNTATWVKWLFSLIKNICKHVNINTVMYTDCFAVFTSNDVLKIGFWQILTLGICVEAKSYYMWWICIFKNHIDPKMNTGYCRKTNFHFILFPQLFCPKHHKTQRPIMVPKRRKAQIYFNFSLPKNQSSKNTLYKNTLLKTEPFFTLQF